MLLGPLAPMQSCVEPRRHVTYRRCNSPAQVGAHLSRAVKDEEMSAVAEAHDASGLSGPNSSTTGGSGSFYGSQQCCHPASKKVDSLCSISRLGALAGSPSMYSKAALVWPPGPDTHVKSAGLAATASTAPVRPVSPSSGLVHWMSMMSDHAHVNVPSHSAPHEVHYMWNGVETKMNTSEQHNSPSLQKGPGNSLEEGRTGGMESSQMHGMYGNHGNRNNNNSSSPPVSTPASSSSMLVVPQPVNAVVSKNTNLNVPGTGATTNGTGRKYQCKMCPQIFGSKADLQLHTQIHMREAKPYKCSQCSKAFANSSYLSQHTRIHLGIKPYRCEICQRKFTQLSHLQQHIRTHTGDKPYKCRHPGCNKAFSQLSNLQSHSRCHQTDKPYKCNSCYKCFADEASLLEHIPKHKESKHLKTHICQYCGKSYTQETYLAKHMQKHADRIEKRGAHPPVGSNIPNPAPSSRIPTSSENFWSTKSSAPSVSEGASLGDGTTTSGAAVSHHVHSHVSESCLQSNLVDHSRLHLASREVDHHRQHMCITSSSGMSNTTNSTSNSNTRDHNDMSHSSHLVSTQGHYDTSNIATGTNKSTSAFTPIQAGMLPISSGTQMSMPGSSRSYFPYESFGFSKTSSQVTSMDVKPPHNTFPNQLIALHQIRNYASMPSITGGEHPITLKDKSQQ